MQETANENAAGVRRIWKRSVHRQYFSLRSLASLYLVYFLEQPILNMAWPCIFCGSVFVCPQSPYCIATTI